MKGLIEVKFGQLIGYPVAILKSSDRDCKALQYMYSETSNNGLSKRRTTSVQRTNSMPPIALPIEIVHLEPPSSGLLSTLDNGQ